MQDTLQEIGLKVLEYWFLIAAITTAFIMAVIRTAKTNGKIDWLESVMCSIFVYGIWVILSWLNLPEGLGVLIGGLVGYSGTHVTSKWLYKKLGIDTEENK